MTMPDERTRAVMWTREFLFKIAHGEHQGVLPKEIRSRALTLLRHYPMARDMEIAHLHAPQWFGPPER